MPSVKGDPRIELHYVNSLPDGSLFVWGCWYATLLGQTSYYMGYTREFPTIDAFKDKWSDSVESFLGSLTHNEPQFELDTIRRTCSRLSTKKDVTVYLWYPEFEKFTKVLISKM